MAKTLVRLTENELHGIINRTTQRILKEGNEVRQAQKELYKMGQIMSSVCLRLQGSKYEQLSMRMKDAAIRLNDALIKDIRGER